MNDFNQVKSSMLTLIYIQIQIILNLDEIENITKKMFLPKFESRFKPYK